MLDGWAANWICPIIITTVSVYRAEKNPDSLKTPLYLFSELWKLKDSKLTATQLRHKYEELPQNEKFKWVEKAVKLNAGVSASIWFQFVEIILIKDPFSTRTDKSHELLEQRWAKTVQRATEIGGNGVQHLCQRNVRKSEGAAWRWCERVPRNRTNMEKFVGGWEGKIQKRPVQGESSIEMAQWNVFESV